MYFKVSMLILLFTCFLDHVILCSIKMLSSRVIDITGLLNFILGGHRYYRVTDFFSILTKRPGL